MTHRNLVLAAIVATGCAPSADGTLPLGIDDQSIQACEEQSDWVGDFDGNGRSDILLQHQDGRLALWLMNGKQIASAGFLPNPGSDYRVVALADFDGDSRTDILLQRSSGTLVLWEMNGLAVAGGYEVSTIDTATWSVVGAGDFDGDGHADVLFRSVGGETAMWKMVGPTFLQSYYLPALAPAWTVAAIADFDGDGKADLALQKLDGSRVIWTLDGATVSAGAFLPAADPKLFIAGAGDMSGDGRADLFLQLTSPSATQRDSAVWYMNGTTLANGTATRLTSSSPSDFVAGLGDLDGNGRDDILVRNADGTSGVALLKSANVDTLAIDALPAVDPPWYARTCTPSHRCGNGLLDGDETDVDCGGSECAPCGNGLDCSSNGDCAGGGCVGGKCITVAASLAVGAGHSCMLGVGGEVRCWGQGGPGQLGTGSTENKYAATKVLTGGVARVAAGGAHSCSITASGGAQCWGNNTYWQLGAWPAGGTKLAPTSVTNLPTTSIDVAAGDQHSCVILADGTLRCWGWSTNETQVTATAPPDGGSDNWALDVGYQFACALVSTGASSARCWGLNTYGMLGDATNLASSIPRNVVGLQNGSAIATGRWHACAVDGGAAKCWGRNQFGQLGNGSNLDSNVPVPVMGLGAGVTSIAAAQYASCAVANGGVVCWGIGDVVGSTTAVGPTPKAGLTANVVQVGVGDYHACARKTDGAVWCWGKGSEGRLGNGAGTDSSVPVLVLTP